VRDVALSIRFGFALGARSQLGFESIDLVVGHLVDVDQRIADPARCLWILDCG
jgi:hypothetical protein